MLLPAVAVHALRVIEEVNGEDAGLGWIYGGHHQ